MKKIRVYGKEKETEDGKKFVDYSFKNSKDEFYQVKFTKDCTTQPRAKGYFLIEVDEKNINLQHKKQLKDGFKPNDVLWIKEVKSCVEDVDYTRELQEKFLKELDMLLD